MSAGGKARKKAKNGTNGRTSESCFDFIPKTTLSSTPTNMDVICLLKGMSGGKKILKSAPSVADIVCTQYNLCGVLPNVTRQRVVQKIEELWLRWKGIQKDLNSSNAQAEMRELQFKTDLRKTFAVGTIPSQNPRYVTSSKFFKVVCVQSRLMT